MWRFTATWSCDASTWCSNHSRNACVSKRVSLNHPYRFNTITEAFEQNVRRAHHQVALCYSALGGDPPAMNAVEYGWESDDTNRRLIPRNMADGISYAPEHILKLVRCGFSSEWPCKGGNCSCMGHQFVCTMFCACGIGSTCANPFSTKMSVTDVTDNSDTKSDDDNHDHDNDYLRTQTLIITIMIVMMIIASCVHTICNLSRIFVIGTMEIYTFHMWRPSAAILELRHQFGTKWSNNIRIELVNPKNT